MLKIQIKEESMEKKRGKNERISKNELFSLEIKMEKVEIPEYEIILFERVMTGEDRRKFNLAMSKDERDDTDTPVNIAPVLIAFCTVYEDGKTLVFSPDNKEDIEEIKKMPSIVTDKLFTVAATINGLTKKSIEEKVKN